MCLNIETKIPRTQVTKFMNKYIKDNDLQNPEKRSEIIPNKMLKELLDIDETTNLTYFNIQKI